MDIAKRFKRFRKRLGHVEQYPEISCEKPCSHSPHKGPLCPNSHILR